MVVQRGRWDFKKNKFVVGVVLTLNFKTTLFDSVFNKFEYFPKMFFSKIDFSSRLILVAFSLLISLKNHAQTSPDQQIVTGMVLKNDSEPLNSALFFAKLKVEWGIAVDSFSEKERTIVFAIDSAIVMMASMDYAVPMLEWAAPAGISWLWKTAKTDVQAHRSQIVISVAGKHGRSVKLYQDFTKIAAAVLETTASSGVFMPNQYLLLPRGFYVESVKKLRSGDLPVYLWTYFGMTQENGLASCYSWGLSEFGMKEMEINDTPRSIQEAHAIFFDAVEQVLHLNLRLKTGDKITIQNDESVAVQLSKGVLLDEVETVKILLK